MQSFFDLEFIRQFNNLLILALGALAIIFILRGVFKLAWKVIKIIFIVLTFADVANLWLAVLADMGASILVTLNGMRLMRQLW